MKTTAERLRQQGREEGRAEGRAEMLLRLLTRRFGPLPAETEARVRTGSISQLDRWAEAVLDATTLDDVFKTG